MSDTLASKIKKQRGWRSGRANGDLRAISNDIHDELKTLFPGLKGGQDKFNFRIFSEKEWAEKFADDSPFFFID